MSRNRRKRKQRQRQAEVLRQEQRNFNQDKKSNRQKKKERKERQQAQANSNYGGNKYPKGKIIRPEIPVTLMDCESRSVFKPEKGEKGEKMVHGLETTAYLNQQAVTLAELQEKQTSLKVLSNADLQEKLAKLMSLELDISTEKVLNAVQNAVNQHFSEAS